MEAKASRRRIRTRLLVGSGLLLVVAVLLVGWNRAASSPSFCSSCHSMDGATVSAARSVHAEVPCLACHTRPGLLGTLRYVPSLAREGVATATGWSIADGILDSADCESCHKDLRATPQLKEAHPQDGPACMSCHGDVAHPNEPGYSPPAPTASPSPGARAGSPHPTHYTQTHGRDVALSPASCADCHEPEFCTACHFRTTIPHKGDWIGEHGAAQEAEGSEACSLCHPSTFCIGCHGTEIPHQETWLGEHWRAIQDISEQPCLVCHPPRDCTNCHERHGVHKEQNLYG